MCGAVVALTAVHGCGSDRRAGGADAGAADAGHADTGTPDAGEPDAGPTSCAEQAPLDVDIAIDPGGPDTQIHAAAAFDGEGIWVVYNRPEPGDTGNFDVWAQRLGCDGEPLLPSPFRVNTTTAPNDVDPDLAVSEGRVLFAWQSDSGEFPDNLSLYYRVFEADGTAVMDEDAELITTWDGADATGNHWEPSLTARPGGGFVVAGSRAIPDATTFQVFAQPLTGDGTLDGDTWYPLLEPDVSQTAPTVTVRDGGAFEVLWTRDDGTAEQVYAMTSDGEEPMRVEDGLDSSSGATVSPFFAAVMGTTSAGESDVVVMERRGSGDFAGAHSVGADGRVDHSPRLTSLDTFGAAAWYRNVSGLRNELWLVRFVQTFDFFDFGDEQLVAEDVPPYQPAITHVGTIDEGVYFVAWSEGTSPDFRIVGRFVGRP